MHESALRLPDLRLGVGIGIAIGIEIGFDPDADGSNPGVIFGKEA